MTFALGHPSFEMLEKLQHADFKDEWSNVNYERFFEKDRVPKKGADSQSQNREDYDIDEIENELF